MSNDEGRGRHEELPWIDWNGLGPCPVFGLDPFQVQLRNGKVVTILPEDRLPSWRWHINGAQHPRDFDIVRYRYVADAQDEGDDDGIVPGFGVVSDVPGIGPEAGLIVLFRGGGDPQQDAAPPADDQDTDRPHGHYFKSVRGLDSIDVYRVLQLFEVTDPALQHIVKKALCAGRRGSKSFEKDVREIAVAAKRRVEMLEEECEL